MCSCNNNMSNNTPLLTRQSQAERNSAFSPVRLVTAIGNNLRPMLVWEIIGAAAGYYVAPRIGYSTSAGLIVGFLAPPTYRALTSPN